MIVKENITIGNNDFIRTYSDKNCYVVREGVSYEEAIDPIDMQRAYSEGSLIDNYELPEGIFGKGEE